MNWFDGLAAARQDALIGRFEAPHHASVRKFASADADFGCWLLAAADICAFRLGAGASIFDFPGVRWRECYEHGQSPGEGFMAMLADHGLAGGYYPAEPLLEQLRRLHRRMLSSARRCREDRGTAGQGSTCLEAAAGIRREIGRIKGFPTRHVPLRGWQEPGRWW